MKSGCALFRSLRSGNLPYSKRKNHSRGISGRMVLTTYTRRGIISLWVYPMGYGSESEISLFEGELSTLAGAMNNEVRFANEGMKALR